MHRNLKIKARAKDIFPKKSIFLCLLNRDGHILNGQGIFLPNVNIALAGADGIASDDQPL